MAGTEYAAQSARDAQRSGYGGPKYADYLEKHATELHAYYTGKGQPEEARRMLTRTLSESLMGNEGD